MLTAPTSFLALTFLAPAVGIIAAAIATPILLLFYFLKLRRRTARVSSTLLWEQAVQDLQANVPFRLIRPSWMLLLQLLILASLVLALARPALDAEVAPAQRTILVIDASASMDAAAAPAAREQRTTRLDLAKREAAAIIDRLAAAPGHAMIISFANDLEALSDFSRNQGLLRNAIDAIEQTDQPVDLEAAARALRAFVVSSGEQDAPAPPRIVFISDGNIPEASEPIGLGSADVQFIKVGEGNPANLGIVSLAARRDYEDPAVVRVFVRIINTSAEARSVGLLLSLDGAAIDSATLEVPGASPDAAGSVAHTFELQAREGLLLARLTAADALPADNAAALVLAPPVRPRVILVTPEGLAGEAAPALHDALLAIQPESLRTLAEQEYRAAAASPDFFADIDLAVFHGVVPEILPPVPTISFAAGLPVAGLAIAQADAAGATALAFWLRSHPLMRGVSLNTVLFADAAHLVLPTELAEINGAPLSVTTLATGLAGPAIALLEHGGVRRLVIAPSLEGSNWPTDQSFPIFIAGAVDYLTQQGMAQAGQAFTTAEPAWAAVPAGVLANEVTVRGPEGFARTVTTTTGRAALGILPLAGIYEVEAGDLVAPLAVNLVHAGESSLRELDVLPFAGGQARAGAQVAAAPRELWPWLVLAALVLLEVEWMLFVLRARV